MKFLIIMFLIVGCSYSPKYKAGECFNIGPIVTKILEIKDSNYIIEVDMMGFIKQKIKRPVKEFDEAIEEEGVVVEKCEE